MVSVASLLCAGQLREEVEESGQVCVVCKGQRPMIRGRRRMVMSCAAGDTAALRWKDEDDARLYWTPVTPRHTVQKDLGAWRGELA